MLKFIKDWTLPLAMLAGVMGYFCLARCPFLAPARPLAKVSADVLTPCLIFSQLLLTFCKVEFRELAPRRWHGWLLAVQSLASLAVVFLLLLPEWTEGWRIALEGLLVCLICPTATAAAVITGKLGGSAASLTTYTLLSNLLAAVMVPLLFPLVEPSGVGFGEAFCRILGRVFPLLLFPFLVACLLRRFFPSVHRWLAGLKDLAFYLWAAALVIVMAQTTRSVVEGGTSFPEECLIASLAFFACAFQFALGKYIGGCHSSRISGGQALGQKNTVLAIWMANAYLNPVSALAPGSYVVWQNLVNSYQLWKRRARSA